MEHDWNTSGKMWGELKQSEKAESAMKLHRNPVIMTSTDLFVCVLSIVISILIASPTSQHISPSFMQCIICTVRYRPVQPIITLTPQCKQDKC